MATMHIAHTGSDGCLSLQAFHRSKSQVNKVVCIERHLDSPASSHPICFCNPLCDQFNDPLMEDSVYSFDFLR